MFNYSLNYWDQESMAKRHDTGIVAADSYSDAADKLCEYFGKENIINLFLCQWEDVIPEADLRDEFDHKVSKSR